MCEVIKFVFGLHNSNIRNEVMKIHLQPNNILKNKQDVVAETKAKESAQKTNRIVGETTNS